MRIAFVEVHDIPGKTKKLFHETIFRRLARKRSVTISPPADFDRISLWKFLNYYRGLKCTVRKTGRFVRITKTPG